MVSVAIVYWPVPIYDFYMEAFGDIKGNAQRGSLQLILCNRINTLVLEKQSNDLKMESLGPLINNKFLEV